MNHKKYFDNDKGELLKCVNCRQQCAYFTEYTPIVKNRFEYTCKECSSVSLFCEKLVDIEANISLNKVFKLDGIDKFSLYDGGFNWLYFNPDASCQSGQIVESSICSQSILDAVKEACNQTKQSFNAFFWNWLYQEATTYLHDNDGSYIFFWLYDELKNSPCDIGKKSDEEVIGILIAHAEKDLGINDLTPP